MNRYILLRGGDKMKVGDEYFQCDGIGWVTIDTDDVGTEITEHHLPFRRKITAEELHSITWEIHHEGTRIPL